MKKNIILWSAFSFILLVFVWGIINHLNIKEKEKIEEAKKLRELEKKEKILNNLETSRLFGISLGSSAIQLISGLNNFEPTDKEYYEWFEPTGILKGTLTNTLGRFSLRLNDFISGKTLDWLFLYKNKDFDNYYINYQPYGDYKITTIFASLKKYHPSYEECIKALRPYATTISERIKKENPDDSVVVEDLFFPKIKGASNSAKIIFKYNKPRDYLDQKWILTISAYCGSYNDKKNYLQLNAPRLAIQYNTYQKIMKEINKQKEIESRNKFDEEADQNESSLDKTGL